MVSRSAASPNRLVGGSILGGGFFFAYVCFFTIKKVAVESRMELNGK